MKLSCPHCGFSRELPQEKLPARRVNIVCPKCAERFSWSPPMAAPAKPEAAALVCPACGERQEKRLACRSCGVVFSRLAERKPAAAAVKPSPSPAVIARKTPKAGFWLRCAAAVIDLFVYFGVLTVLVIGMGLIISYQGGNNPQELGMMGVLMSFIVMAFGYLYRVFFIGYCGQTPGKMTTRIKVIRCNGDEVGFGAAIFREVIGKFISQLLLMAGYVMIGFDEQKQGLHDKLADTYVIKL